MTVVHDVSTVAWRRRLNGSLREDAENEQPIVSGGYLRLDLQRLNVLQQAAVGASQGVVVPAMRLFQLLLQSLHLDAPRRVEMRHERTGPTGSGASAK